jgi:hypothetical protein
LPARRIAVLPTCQQYGNGLSVGNLTESLYFASNQAMRFAQLLAMRQTGNKEFPCGQSRS